MVKIVQVNLGRRDIAAKEIQLWVANPNEKIEIILIQEPRMQNNKPMDIKGGVMYYTGKNLNKPARTAIWISDTIKDKVNGELLEEFSGRDITTINLTLPNKGGGRQKVIFCSAYCPALNENGAHINEPLDHLKIKLIEHVHSRKLEMVFAGDFNAHSKAFGDKKNDERGNWLVDFLMGSNLLVLNVGNEPTFEQNNNSSLIDLTMATPGASRRVREWHIDTDFVFSDHKAICFEFESQAYGDRSGRIRKRTNWISYQNTVAAKCEGYTNCINTIEELELRANNFRDILISSFHENCKVKTKNVKYYTDWYSRELEGKRLRVRKAHSSFNKTIDPTEKLAKWKHFTELRDEYKKVCNKNKRESWRQFVGEIDEVKEAARLQKLLEKGKPRMLTGLIKDDGTYTSNTEECVRELMTTHFPECRELESDEESNVASETAREEEYSDIDEATTDIKIRWAMDCLSPYKSPGEDDIFPALLQKAETATIPVLKVLFRASLKLDYIPTTWRGTYVTFIPKDGKTSYDKAKSFRPISLMSFVLKILEKLVDRNIRDKALKYNPIDKDQHAYQTGKDTNSAIHQLVTKLERTLTDNGTALTVMLDISGAFDNTDFSSIEAAARKHGVKDWEVNWIKNMLKNRIVKAKMDDSRIRYNPTRGCPQGGCLSPLLWCLVVNSLIILLKSKGFHVVAYADDFAITITSNSKLQSVLPDKLREAMKIVEKWCQETKLDVNPDKTYFMRHTRKGRNLKLNNIKLNGKNIAEVQELKYLGVTIDSKLAWTNHINKIINKTRKSLWATRAMVAKSWGISPKIMMWIYKQIILPRITYGCVVWWQKARIKKYAAKLESIQRSALMMVTGAMRSTPTKALTALLSINPLGLQIQSCALKTCARLRWNGGWITCGNQNGHREISLILDKVAGNDWCDRSEIKWNTNYTYNTIINERSNWNQGLFIEKNINCWYSDGSKRDERVAFGVYNPIRDLVLEARISNHGTIMQAEMKGIEECARRSKELNVRGGKVLILSDSQAAIKALRNVKVTTATTWACIQELNMLSKQNKVTVAWVPGHSNVLGNDVADRLANQGIDRNTIDVEVPIAKKLMENKIDEWTTEQTKNNWNIDKVALLHSNDFLPGHDKKLAKKLLNLKRNDLRVCVAMWTGHGCLNDFLFKINKAENTNCTFCEEDVETMRHLLCHCPALINIRRKVFEAEIPNGEDFKKMEPKKLLKFARESQLYELLKV